uniref:Hypothetical conserved protein n=1 Tax=uncultured Bacteroidota bacterium TaxID=152509 RepID=H5SIF4_9BACT|nr:hypothetical conserved protein [uncultured Bacteroidetes bacterium]
MAKVIIVAIVIGLPVAGGLALAAYSQWLKYRAKAPISPEELRRVQERLAYLEKENQRLRERVENLETIVASPAWETLLASHLHPSPEKGPQEPPESSAKERLL